ncbi:putative nuclear export protein noc3 [Phaeomoniella chlamydospora]|uniref:Nucleolar complex-associated protein 3 n=1 Tax=Phaeomoniella chlamydospora TaxID=158046 RepID=A0A0G2DW38_PHACM|nr:putative nuclear export protein noc3 [Phaeomoniella chlamydospora]
MARGRPAKKRRLSDPVDDDKKSETIRAKDLFHRAAEWDLEQAYEQRPRKKKEKENTRLPIKTAEGKVEKISEAAASGDEVDSFLASDSEVEDQVETPPTEVEEAPRVPLKHQYIAAKEELAKIALHLNENPEEHPGAFKTLGAISHEAKHPAIKKLALATQAAVYKDVIPGYRIRAYKDEELGNKVSKDVRNLRQYEHALITGYQAYVKDLMTTSKMRDSKPDAADLRTVAISCACILISSVPHFNFRTELLGILISQLASRTHNLDFKRCIDTMENFFKMDDDGAPSLEAVGLMAKMMKAKDYRIREEVLNTFFHLRLLTELSTKSSTTRTDKPDEDTRQGKKGKKEWVHRSKKERKVLRERKEVEKDMKEADATVNYEARDRMQSETLKIVFTTYFRILKIQVPELMGAVLEGLAKFAHLINQDFFGDLLEVLKDLVSQSEDALNTTNALESPNLDEEESTQSSPSDNRNYTRESLLSTQTAFTLLSQQDVSKSASSLSLDLSFFTSHIYRSLYPLSLSPDLELGPKSLHLIDPHTTSPSPILSKINIQTPSLLLLRVLHSILLPTTLSSSSLSPTLLATFLKRLLSVCLQTPEKSTLALLTLLSKLTSKHARKLSPLWYTEEQKGDGVFRGDADTIEGTGVWSGGVVWEGELLKKHFCPAVRDVWKGDVDGEIRGLSSV